MSENQDNFNINKLEEKILKFWQENKIFEKSVEKPAGKKPKGEYVFFDGPPFATGMPHYGHLLASIIKDAIPRYQAMKGKRVERRWGWDCHGLPVENEIEKDLGLTNKKDIEKIGVKNFNETARSKVLTYASDWKKIISRIGRWVDMENDYKTMDSNYTESVLWVFKTLYDKGLIYEGYKSMHLCPRCETTLSNFEVAQGYKDITDISVTVKFQLEDELNTYILAWTTTPWTLPGNAALAVNNNFDYVKIKLTTNDQRPTIEFYILAKERLEIIKENYEIIEIFKGKDLIGKKYKPLFDYYFENKNLENRDNGWKIYAADFVTAEEGTGIVHIAPAFGEDDYQLMQKYNLPFIQHVSTDGEFKPEVKDFVGLQVKPKGDHQSTDIEIIKWLAKNNNLFSKQKLIHSYPHCWRCETPLLNYAASSWFVKVSAIKNQLIKNNKKIKWVPEYIKEGRFGNWLKDGRDWAVSRSRFWGAPIPVWRCEKCKKIEVVGSIEDFKKNTKKSGNKYFAMRHGQAESNVENFINSRIENNNCHLTEKGKKQVLAAAKILRQAQDKIDLIFSSDFLRTRETAEIVAEKLGFEKSKIIFDERLREINTGIFDGQNVENYRKFATVEEKFYKTPSKGENLTDLKNRVAEFLYEIDKKYSDKNILIISHEYPIWLLFAGAEGSDSKKAIKMRNSKPDFIKTAEIKKLDFIPLPHNNNYELDFHRPYIDEIEFDCPSVSSGQAPCGGKMRRIPDVFDCWFESGAMPYGQTHYPFENKKKFEKNFPAEFIAEGIDQTRGWFYTLLVLSTGLFNKPAYKNVVVNGIILAEDGEKMSKRLKNYPDPMEIINKYGADALRYYLLSSPIVRAEDSSFSEKGVDEIYKKVILRFWNVYKFYELYADGKIRVNPLLKNKNPRQSASILDQWILARLEELKTEVSKWLDKYELDKAVRPIGDFVDDLSTWYIRRSRERFKIDAEPRGTNAEQRGKDRENAMATTKLVLIEFSKIIAPFMPFMAETIYQQLKAKSSKLKAVNSVHLENWPKSSLSSKLKAQSSKLLKAMAEIRKIASLALEARQKAGIRVRQPLQKLKVNPPVGGSKLKVNKELLEILKDEVNVKEIVFDKNIVSNVELDTEITLELKAEGQLREFTRAIQDLRKKANLKPEQKIILEIQANEAGKELINKFGTEIKKSASVKDVEFKNIIEGEEIKIDELEFKIVLNK